MNRKRFENWIGLVVITAFVGGCYFATTGRTVLNGFVARYLVPREGCQWLAEDPFYTADFSGYTEATFQHWIEEMYGARAENISKTFLEDEFTYGYVFYWSVEGIQYRAIFDADGASHIRVIKQQETLGMTIEYCLGEPDYVQAYESQGGEMLFTVTEIVYPEQGVLFHYTDTLGWIPFPTAANEAATFQSVTRFIPISERTQVAEYLDREWYIENSIIGQRSAQAWADITLQEWNGWNHIDVTTREDFIRAAVTPTTIPGASSSQ